MEADKKILMHAVYNGREENDPVCVIADDTDIDLSLMNFFYHIRSHLLFPRRENQGQGRSKLS